MSTVAGSVLAGCIGLVFMLFYGGFFKSINNMAAYFQSIPVLFVGQLAMAAFLCVVLQAFPIFLITFLIGQVSMIILYILDDHLKK